jgi:hypothetical protein
VPIGLIEQVVIAAAHEDDLRPVVPGTSGHRR